MKKKLSVFTFMMLCAVFILSACGSEEESGNETSNSDNETSTFSLAMVTDEGGVDDRSFNQSAWEGIQAFGEENGLEKGKTYDYAQSNNAADFLPNFNTLVNQNYSLMFGVGYQLAEAVREIALQNADRDFVIIDEVVEGDNIASVTFAEEQGSFLVGAAAALKSETQKIGFIGGITSPLITRFEVGFVAGAKSVNPDIEVVINYAESFSDEAQGRSIANDMYSNDVDVIYHASGAVGLGAFTEARNRVENDPNANVWMIGVDRDQYEQGQQGDKNVTLTSMIKRVDVAVQTVAQQAKDGAFPAGEHIILGIEDNAVSVAETNTEAYTEEIKTEVDAWQEQILSGEIVVPTTQDELTQFLSDL